MAGPWDDFQTQSPAPPKPKAPASHPALDYQTEPQFQSAMDQTYGAGRWRETGGYRTPARNAAVGGVPTSRHMRGTPDAPGAHDIVVPGMDPRKAAEKLPPWYNYLPEGRVGAQGPHLHVDAAQSDPAAPPWSDFSAAGPQAPVRGATTPTPAGAAPAPTTAKPKPASAAPQPSLLDRAGRYAREEIQSQIVKPWEEFASDVTHPYKAPPVHNPWDVVRGIAGQTGHDLKEAGDLAGAVMNTAGGELIHAGIVRPLAEAGSNIPMPAQPGQAAPNRQQREQRLEQGIGTAMLGLGPEGGRITPRARGAVESRPNLPTPKVRRPARGGPTLAAAAEHPEIAKPHPVIGDEPDPVTRVDNALYRLGGHSTAGRIEAQQAIRAAPKAVKSAAVQEELTHAVEQRLIDPEAQIPEHLQEAEAVRQPWAERQRTAINEVREKLVARGATEAELAEYAPDTGYVPRRVVGKSPGIDPTESLRSSPLAIQQNKRGLSRTTSSLRQRDQIILQFEDGTRRFEHRNPSNDEWKPGMTVRDPLTGKPAEVKQATIKEIEGAGARDRNGQPITYHKNALVNTIDEALKAERVNRNIDVLDELTKGLKEQGLAHQNEWHYKNDDGQWVRGTANSRAPEVFQEIPHLPQLKGWSFSPEIAQTLKDYYPGPGESLDNVLSVVNRTLNASLFITPFPHIKNVGTMGFIGRGWDWLPTGTNYGRLMTSGRDAIKEVLTLGPKYKEFLREGAGMQAGDDATRNFYQTLLESASEGIAKDPKIAAATGLNPIEMGKALYAVSHKILWNVNDMVMLQRYLELQSKGMSKRQAIAETEKWIANYRIPPQVLKSRAVARIFKSGNIVNFGRYTYGKWRAIGEMARGMTSKNPAERMDALGKVVAMGVMGLIIYPLMDEAAKKITGNTKAKVGRGGEMGPIDAALDPDKDWVSKFSSILTPAPALETFDEVRSNKDVFGRNIREPQSTALGQGVQLGEYAADQFYPASLGMEAMKPGGAAQAAGRLVGVNLPPEGRDARVAKAKRYERRGALKREAKDEIEALVKSGFR